MRFGILSRHEYQFQPYLQSPTMYQAHMNGYGELLYVPHHHTGPVSIYRCMWNHPSILSTGWFKGLSSGFLACRTARLLVLAGTDRLDKELMIGQMQGKFQMEVMPDVGHMLQEVRR